MGVEAHSTDGIIITKYADPENAPQYPQGHATLGTDFKMLYYCKTTNAVNAGQTGTITKATGSFTQRMNAARRFLTHLSDEFLWVQDDSVQ